MSLASGTPIGPYEIQSLLGVGGMGEVYNTVLDDATEPITLLQHWNPEAKP